MWGFVIPWCTHRIIDQKVTCGSLVSHFTMGVQRVRFGLQVWQHTLFLFCHLSFVYVDFIGAKTTVTRVGILQVSSQGRSEII